jgi:hypothetical protein
MGAPTLRELLLQLSDVQGSKQDAARALGITPGRFSRLLNGEFSMEVVNCLRLAVLTRKSAATVLRAADKQEVADLLDRLYGSDAAAPWRDPELQEALANLAVIRADVRAPVLAMIRAMAAVARTPGHGSPPGRALEIPQASAGTPRVPVPPRRSRRRAGR